MDELYAVGRGCWETGKEALRRQQSENEPSEGAKCPK